jgi:hypothetical protein
MSSTQPFVLLSSTAAAGKHPHPSSTTIAYTATALQSLMFLKCYSAGEAVFKEHERSQVIEIE